MAAEPGSQATTLVDMASFALELVPLARAETLGRFRQETAVHDKASGGPFDPVTEADRAAERAMRQWIRERFPGHGISGEELPDERGTSEWSWSLDPIDGTRSFVSGLVTWTTLVALVEGRTPVLGLVDAPCLDETYVGFGATAWIFRNGERARIRASACTRVAEARLSTTDPALFETSGAEAFERLRRDSRMVRYGHDAYAYARLAAGTIDLVVEIGLKPHDYNALIPLVSGAGGRITDWRGGQDYERGDVIAASTAELLEEARRYFEAA